jgi:HAMP domain-containing protein
MSNAAFIVLALLAAFSVLIATCALVMLVRLGRESRELDKLRNGRD